MALTNDQKWDSVVSNDESSDGKFFYGVKTTGVFCRPSCKSKVPLQKNVEFFDNIEEAYKRGLRPCKRCRPDLFEYKPMTEVLKKAKYIYDTYFDDKERIVFEIKQLNVSKNHLIRLFSNEYGITPTDYINRLRIDRSVLLVKNTDKDILTIAVSCGFGSSSNFYDYFKRYVGVTPSMLRDEKK